MIYVNKEEALVKSAVMEGVNADRVLKLRNSIGEEMRGRLRSLNAQYFAFCVRDRRR